MKKAIFTLTLFIAGSVILSSCGKYEEGPGFTLLPKKTRLTGTWEIDKYEDSNGNESTPSDPPSMTFEKDGDYTITDGSFSISGKWEFNGDKSGIITEFDFFGTTQKDEVTIVRLTNSELITEDEDGDKTYASKQ